MPELSPKRICASFLYQKARVLVTLVTVLYYTAFSVAASELKLSQLHFYANEYPPYNFTQNEEFKGASVTLLKRAALMLNEEISDEKFHFQPWPRALFTVENQSNTVLMTVARTLEREHRFKWVGPVANTRVVIIGKKSSAIHRDDELNQYAIGTIVGDIAERLLIQRGFNPESFHHGNSGEALARMLKFDRIQLWAFEEKVALWSMHKLGMNIDEYKVVIELDSVDFYYAFNKDSDSEYIGKLQLALDRLKQKRPNEIYSEFERIFQHYPDWHQKW